MYMEQLEWQNFMTPSSSGLRVTRHRYGENSSTLGHIWLYIPTLAG